MSKENVAVAFTDQKEGLGNVAPADGTFRRQSLSVALASASLE